MITGVFVPLVANRSATHRAKAQVFEEHGAAVSVRAGREAS